jgi:ubiquinone/menaquinone biosynthesis C-methylase UbiE
MEKHNPQEYKERSKAHFEKLSSNYSDSYAGKYTAPMYDAVMQELDEKTFTTLLDVGCGTGTFLSKVLDKFDVKVAGIDISPGMVGKSRDLLGEHADLRVGDSEHSPWDDESFDTVTCVASFHHYPNPVPVLKELRRVLRNGGSAIIADPWTANPWRFLANMIIRSPLNRTGEVRIYSQEELQEMLDRAGFTLNKWKTRKNSWKSFYIATALRG